MTLPKPTIVIFDMDGTTVRHLNPWVLHLLERLDDAAFKIGRIVKWVFEKHAQGPLDLENIEAAKKKKLIVHRAIHKVRRKPVEQIVEPCPGVMTVLNFLRQQKIPLALVSSGLGKGYGHDVLEKFGLEKYFTTTVFREDIGKSKPNPEPILLALQRLERKILKKDIVWYIGDRHKDVTAALAANDHINCRVVPIAYGLNAAVAALEKNIGTEAIIMSYQDMHKRLKGLFAAT